MYKTINLIIWCNNLQYLPITVNGKVDKNSLPEVDFNDLMLNMLLQQPKIKDNC